MNKQESYPRHPSKQRGVVGLRFQRMAFDQLSVLLITYLIRNVHVMAEVRGCSNRITKSIYNQRGKKNTPIDRDLGEKVRSYFQCIDHQQIVCECVCVSLWDSLYRMVLQMKAGLYLLSFLQTAAGSICCTVSCLWPTLSLKSNTKLISSIPGQVHKAMAYCKQGSGCTDTCRENNWTTALCILSIFLAAAVR